jgi:hypothetical protein
MNLAYSSAAIIFFFLVACAATPGVPSKVDAAVVGLTTAESLALVYVKLPRCGTVASMFVCSDLDTMNKLKALDNIAYKAVKAAENNEALLSDALIAVTAFQSAIPK